MNSFQIASIFYYLCVVTLQYIAPILMCLYFALMYKTLGGYNWSDLFANNTANATCAAPPKEAIVSTPLDDGFSEFTEEQASLDKSILESAKELQSSFHGLKAVIVFFFFYFKDIFASCIKNSPHQYFLLTFFQVFTTDVYRGLFGFATWWTCFVWFAASSLGMIYQSYFTKF